MIVSSSASAPAATRANAVALALVKALVSATAAAFLGSLAAASPNVPPPPQTRPLVITGATLHTLSGGVIPNGSLRIEAGRIVALGGPDAGIDLRGAEVISLPGKHVYPGFINANSVTGLTEIDAVRATDDFVEAGPVNPNARALVAVNPDSELIPVTRANGVLAALTVPQAGKGGLIAGTSALVQLDGWTWEDMSIESAVALHVHLPPMRFNPALFPPPEDARLDEMRKASAARLKTLETAFDDAAAYRAGRSAGTAVKLDTRWEAMLPVLDGRRPVFMQADDVAQIRYALAFAERHRVRLVIVGGSDAWRLADVLRERRVPVVIAGVHALPDRRDEPYDTPYRLAARLAQAGVAFCIAREASGFAAPNDRNLPFEAATAAAFGLDRGEALKAITLYPAQILGVADRLGSLEVGKLASFSVTDGDPLEIETKIERVFIRGREVDLANRQTRLAEKYRQKARQQQGEAGSGSR